MENHLKRIGISNESLSIYEALLDLGYSTASKISLKSGVQRSYVYLLLDELIKKGLVEKKKAKNNKFYFYPLSPNNIDSFYEEEKDNYESFASQYEKIKSKLLSKYNMLEGKPSIAMYEGIEGLKKLYKDMLIENKDFKLIRSNLDDSNPEIFKLILEQIDNQIKQGMKLKVIAPELKGITKKQLKERDIKRNTSRKIIKESEFENTSQIIIYGNKVAVTSFTEPYYTTITESAEVRQTFDNIFDYMWLKGEDPY